MKNYLILLCISILSVSCENAESKQRVTYFDKILMPNYGSFGGLQNGSLSAYFASEDSVHQDVYSEFNDGKKLGDGVQHVILSRGKIYISVVDESKIVVLNAETLKEEKVIETGSGSGPNYITTWESNYIYTTDLYFDKVLKIDKVTGKITKRIPVGSKPWQILSSDKYLFVANSGYGNGNTVSVIDPNADTVIKTIKVAYNPNYMTSTQNSLFVLCSAYFPNDAVLYKIDKLSFAKTDSVVLDNSPLSQISIEGNQLYYYLGYAGAKSGVKRIDISGKLGQPTSFSAEEGIPFFDYENHDVYLIYPGTNGMLTKLLGNAPTKKHKLGIQPTGEAIVIYKTGYQ